MINTFQGIKSAAGVSGRLKYINKPDALVYTKNMFSFADDIDGLNQEFTENAKYLEGVRGKNLAFSEILSLPQSNNVSKEEEVQALKTLVDEHIRLRGLESHLAVIAIHNDSRQTHAHCLFSSNPLFGTHRHRVSNKEFLQSQQKLEQIRNKKFPHFTPTNHYSKKLEKRIKLAEGKMKYLRGALTEKQKINATFKHALTKQTKKEFQTYLKSKNLIVYKRGAKTIGLRDLSKRKNYRLETLEKGLRAKFLGYEKTLNIKQKKQKIIQKPKPIKKTPHQEQQLKKGGKGRGR